MPEIKGHLKRIVRSLALTGLTVLSIYVKAPWYVTMLIGALAVLVTFNGIIIKYAKMLTDFGFNVWDQIRSRLEKKP